MQLTSTCVFLAFLASGGSRVFSLPMGADVTDLDACDVELDLEARDYDANFEARDYADFELEARDFEEDIEARAVDSTVKAPLVHLFPKVHARKERTRKAERRRRKALKAKENPPAKA